ncbi:MAG TPA: DPP IV N-terminal domain-containing protein [Dehalococcoidia bacterium]|nr:DPP IV N-terminal domain-containing protein [Dehalococcoidia bacterium]
MLRRKRTTAIFLIIGLVLIAPFTGAQDTKQAEREAMYYRYLEFASYVKGGSIEPHWMADGSSFWYAEGVPANTVIWRVDPTRNTKAPLFDVVRLRRALGVALGHEPPSKGLPFSDFVFLDGETAVKFRVENKEFVMALGNYAITQSPGAPQAADAGTISPDGRWFARVQGAGSSSSGLRGYGDVGLLGDVWVRSADTGENVQVTADGVEGYGWTLGLPAIRAKWSPDSRKLALRKMDLRGTPMVSLLHYLEQPERATLVYYPKAGERRGLSELCILDVTSKRQMRIHAAEEPGPTPLVWRLDGSELLFLNVARYDVSLDLMATDPTTGSTRRVLTESDPWPYLFRQPEQMVTLLRDGRRFIWMSARDGWNHLYLYDLDGTLIRRLTRGAFPVVRVIDVDEQAGWIYFTAQSDPKRPYDTHLCRVTLEGQRFQQLTDAPGQHDIQMAPSKQVFLDTHSSVDRPPVVEIRRADGGLLQTVSRADVSAVMNEMKWRAPEEFVVKAADGNTPLHGVIYKPYDFDPNTKYPVLQFFGVARRFFQDEGYSGGSLAQLGYIVVTASGRGTGGRGKVFQDADRGHLGQLEVADQVAVLKQLAATRPFMDLTRVGVLGGSYPGFMTTRAMLLAPDVYRVGVSINSISDMAAHWRNEGLLGPPETNRAAYEYASNLRLASALKGRLLLIHGTRDTDVPISHTMRMVDALIKARKRYDLIVLPDQPHVPTGNSWTYMRDRIAHYLQEHLKP